MDDLVLPDSRDGKDIILSGPAGKAHRRIASKILKEDRT